MNEFLNFLRSDGFLMFSFIISIILVITVIVLVYKLYKLKKDYIILRNGIGNGEDLDKFLKNYITDVDEVKKDNEEIKAYYTKLNNDIEASIQKVGLVRYNAYDDVGSDLSFALALLDNNNDGVVINGIYGAESSNTYAKPIKNGESKYQLSSEESYAIEIAEQNKAFKQKKHTNKTFNEAKKNLKPNG